MTGSLYERVGSQEVPARDSQAIVEMPSGRVVSVVGRGYRLVSHAEALGLAQDCAREAFPETKPGEWQVASVDAPSTGGIKGKRPSKKDKLRAAAEGA